MLRAGVGNYLQLYEMLNFEENKQPGTCIPNFL
jgi:hypothetical protein